MLTRPLDFASIRLVLGDLAQLVEHSAHIRVVIGSIPMVAKNRLLRGGFFIRAQFLSDRLRPSECLHHQKKTLI